MHQALRLMYDKVKREPENYLYSNHKQLHVNLHVSVIKVGQCQSTH